MSSNPSSLDVARSTPCNESVHTTPQGIEATASNLAKHSRSEIALTDQTNLLPLRRVLTIFAGLSICALVTTLDSTIVATALPSISAHFKAGSVSSWVPSAYLLTSTAFQPMYGRFSDIFGRKAAMCAAMGMYMFGCLLAGFSQSIISLIIFRGIAGAGGGGIVSIMQIIISDVVSLRDRGKYIGIIGGVISVGYALGPLIGGILAQKVTWRWCFWVTLPLSAVSVVIVLLVLPLKHVEGNFRRKLLIIDYLGCMLTLGGCALLILPLIWGGVTFPWNSPVVLAPLFSGFVVVVMFCIWEWKGAKLPIVPMYIFKHVTVGGVYITMFVNGIIFFSSLFYLPQFFQVGLGYSPIRSGIFLLPVLVSQTLASLVAGQIISRTGHYRTVIHVGFTVWAVGCGCLSTVTPSTSKGLLVFYMLLTGTGAGQTLQTTTVAAQASVSRRDMSVVTAVRNFVRLLGGTFALAIGATIINNALRHSMNQLNLPSSVISAVVDDPTVVGSIISSPTNSTSSLGLSKQQATHILRGYNDGFRAVFIMNATLAAFATIVSVVMIRQKNLDRDDDADLRAKAEKEELERSHHHGMASQSVTRQNSDIELAGIGSLTPMPKTTNADENIEVK
ncbi:major facilitator superfamily domain-containing protein [Irpex rosettiformis]|uniref:Major facilitator superfamily domain-containing protein n=1 Tax=Irpex rosettiformis TaxID=378272 RepID=A0ACB8TYD7_9APHY|nr:major facilitator superfamily domain-containing protein [Irpex rosettiformis]